CGNVAAATMSRHVPSRLVLAGVVILVALPLACLTGGCRSGASDAEPAIEFTTIPPAGNGGPDTLMPIAGRVKGAHANQRIVLFAKSGNWWVQPFRSRPFTTIEQDGTWKSTIHLGTEYAALVVAGDYRPPVNTDALPTRGA